MKQTGYNYLVAFGKGTPMDKETKEALKRIIKEARTYCLIHGEDIDHVESWIEQEENN